jgi:DNA repair protein RadC
MTITTWPILERPREKLLTHGVSSLSDAELLAIFLRTGIPGKTALDIARELLSEYGSLKNLFHASPHEIVKKPSIGKAKYAALKAAIELGRRYLEEGIQIGETLNDSRLTKRFLINRLQDYSHEVFACLFLDNGNRVISFETLFHGTINEAVIYPREVVKRGLSLNAVKLILAHNHPSGDPSPSQADKNMTQILQQTLALVDIQVIDHIVIGNKQCTSFAELGLL